MVDTGLNGHLINHRFKDIVEAVGKRPFAALPSSLVTAAYAKRYKVQGVRCKV